MATLKLLLYKSKTLKNGKHPVMIRITHGKLKYISTGYSSTEDEWDASNSQFSTLKKNRTRLNNLLATKYTEAEDAIIELEKKGKPYTVDDIARKIASDEESAYFLDYTRKQIDSLKKAKRLGNAAVYQTIYNIVKEFVNEKDFTFDELNYKWLNKFETHCLSEKASINGVNVYMRTIRALYNKAIKEKVALKELYPFTEYKIKHEKPIKRAISLEDIKKIKKLRLKKDTFKWHVRNYFMFSFYCMGMSWVDMAYLKLENIKDGRILYKRAKTGKEYSIMVTDKIQEILVLYTAGKKRGDFIFPIILRPKDPELARKDLKNGIKNYNKYLRKIAEQCKIETNLTSYVARHSWATIANRKGVHIGIISEGLGHEDIKTTQTYLEGFGSEELDQANQMITDL